MDFDDRFYNSKIEIPLNISQSQTLHLGNNIKLVYFDFFGKKLPLICTYTRALFNPSDFLSEKRDLCSLELRY